MRRFFVCLILGVSLWSVAFGQRQATFEELDAIVGDAKYVNFGEDSHFMTGVHRYVAESFKHLAEKKGFRVFVFESAWGIEDALVGFMNSDRTKIEGDESLFLNAFNSKSTVEMLIWIREWNRKNPNDKIRIAGYQPEQPVTDFNALWAFAGKSKNFETAGVKEKAKVCRAGTGEFKGNLDFIGAGSRRRRSGTPTFTAEERADCNKAIDGVEAFIESNKKELIKASSKNAYLESGAHLKSLRTYLNTITPTLDFSLINKNPTPEQQRDLTAKIYHEGDKARWEIFQVLEKTRYGGKKIYFWMHNWHAMKRSGEVGSHGREAKDVAAAIPGGTISMGTRMAQAYGDKLVVIGNLVPKVICNTPRCGPKAIPREDSLETKFASVYGGGSGLLDLRNAVKRESPLPISASGSLYADFHQGHFINVVLNRQFDAIYYLSETGAVFEDR